MRTQEEWRSVFGVPDAAFNARIDQTFQKIREGRTMKRFTMRTGLVLAIILLLTIGTVCAASMGMNIGAYFAERFGGRQEVPQGFDSGFDTPVTLTAAGVTFTMEDAYLNGRTLIAVARLECQEGGRAAFLGPMVSPDDPYDSLLLHGTETANGATIAQRCDRLYEVDAMFRQNGRALDGVLDVWMNEDGTGGMMLQSENVLREGEEACVTWQVSVLPTGEGAAPERRQTELRVRAEAQKEWDVPVNRRVAGLPLQVDSLHIREGRLGKQVDILFSVLPETSEADSAALEAANCWFELLDPETLERLPTGISLTAGIEADESGLRFRQTGETISPAYAGDTIVLRAYDAWEKTRFGMVEVKLR